MRVNEGGAAPSQEQKDRPVRRASALLLALIALAVACDRRPTSTPVAPSSPTPSATATLPASTTPTPSTASQTPAATPVPVVAKGIIRPRGRFLVTRFDGLWIVEPSTPSERRLLQHDPRRMAVIGFLPSAEAPTDVIVAQWTDPSSTELLRISLADGKVSTFFEIATCKNTTCGIPAVSPDGRLLAYLDPTGLKIHDLSTGSDTLVYRNPPSGLPMGCRPDQPMIPASYRGRIAWWSPDGRFLLATGVAFEPVATLVFDARGGEQPGTVVPRCAGLDAVGVWVGNQILTDDGNCYSERGRQQFWYDIGTRTITPLRSPSGLAVALASSVVTSTQTGDIGMSWRSRGEDRPSLVTIQTRDGSIIASASITADVFGWLPDGAGVVVKANADQYTFKFYVMDRAGALWDLPDLPLDVTRIDRILP